MEEKIDYHGIKISKNWLQEIEESQNIKEIVISGIAYPRIKYGSEQDDWGANDHPCGDCAVIKEQYHVPGCDIERCPSCNNQAISCDCEYEGDDDADEEELPN